MTLVCGTLYDVGEVSDNSSGAPINEFDNEQLTDQLNPDEDELALANWYILRDNGATSSLAADTSEGRRMAQAGQLKHGAQEAGPWYNWGPYVSERAWGSVREDYSDSGDAWSFFPFDHAVSRAYRWSEDGMGAICNQWQDICIGLALWNGKDPILKERMFGLSGHEGNHGEDVKECYWYTDATPSHSWLSWRYFYPHAEFPYQQLRDVNANRSREEPEYEIEDTGVFDDNRYWKTEIDYAKDSPDDIYMRIRITNMGPEAETIHALPSLWFRDTWSWGKRHKKPVAKFIKPIAQDPLQVGTIHADQWRLGEYHFSAAPASDGTKPKALFCENETNSPKIWGAESPATTKYPKDGINDRIIHGAKTVNPRKRGTKASWWYKLTVDPGQTVELRLRLWDAEDATLEQIFADWSGAAFDQLMITRKAEADDFYAALTPPSQSPAALAVMRQAFAGMIWTKQFYRYNVKLWLEGDPQEPAPPAGHQQIRNTHWSHFDAYDVLSMPDKWEYPWFAAWDLAFHTVVFAHIDPEFAKYQLSLMLREWYMHPNGAIPAYEWSFDDINPPVHAWAALKVYEIDGERDSEFLASVFMKLLLNFTWWVNRVDADGTNIFEGGFLGLDNIGPIDRTHVPPGFKIEQADGTAWMAFYCLTMLRIALRLSAENPAYRSMMLKFLEHFAAITDGINAAQMWDADDGFFYDQLIAPDGSKQALRVKSIVGLIPVLAAAFVGSDAKEYQQHAARIEHHFSNFLARRGLDTSETNQAGFVIREDNIEGSKILLTVVDPDSLRRVLGEVLDEESFLSPYGVRSLSRRHLAQPFQVEVQGEEFSINYEPAESTTPMYGGNSNWRGPVWFPINQLIIEALERYHLYLGDDFKVECPTGSGVQMNLQQVSDELRRRLISLFVPDETGSRPCNGNTEKQNQPDWNDAVLFHEYFNGDTGAGIGASHQTGWTGLVADLILGRPNVPKK